MTRRSRRRRPKRVAAAVVAGGLMLVPAAMATTTGRAYFPTAASFADGVSLPNAGDLLAAVRRAQAEPEDYGASGKLPDADTLSPELLAALAGPAAGDPGIFGTGAGPLATVTPGPLGIPGVMLEAYTRAADALAVSHPNCGLHWSVLAAIGRIESGHARGGAVDAQGTTVRPILGPQLNGGPGIAAIRDSDGGALDSDRVWDRAVGPMQFIPTTWRGYAADGNNDGVANPHNVYDATVAAGRYLCAGGGDLRQPAALAQAIFRYNHSDAYVANVLSWAAAYANGVTPIPSSPLPVEPVGEQPQAAPPPETPPPGTTPPGTTTTATTTTTTAPTTTTTTTTTTSPTCPTAPTSPTTSPTPVPPGCPTPTTTATTTTTTTAETGTETGTETATGTGTETASETAAETSTETSSETPAGASSTTTSLPPA